MKISIICNADFTENEDLKRGGGDYWVKLALAEELGRMGHVIADDAPDAVVHLFGWPIEILRSDTFNILWIHSHPDLVTPDILSNYQKIFCISPKFTEKIRSWGFDAEFLMFPTSKRPVTEAIKYDIVFPGNAGRSLAKRGRKIVFDLIDAYDDFPYKLKVYGRNWDGLIPEKFFGGENFPYQSIGKLYASSKITLNDHHEDMCREGFLNPRILDVLASGGFVISDRVDGLEEVFGETVPMYSTKEELRNLVDYYISNPEARRRLAREGQEIALRYTYREMALRICDALRDIGHRHGRDAAGGNDDSKRRITFLAPHLRISGGVKRILALADLLKERGHETFVATSGRLDERSIKPEKADLIEAPGLSEEFLPDADIVVLSYTNGPGRKVMKFERRKGEKFLLVLHFGVHSPVKEVSNLRLPFRMLATSTWLKEVCGQFSEDSHIISYGLDMETFYPVEERAGEKKTIGMLYHTHSWKGVEDGVKAFRIAREIHPEIKLIMFGQPEDPDVECDEYYHDPSPEELRRIYSRCDIFLCPSWREGIGMTSLEAMACKAALVTTDTCGNRDFALHEETALVSPPRRPDLLARNLIRLIEDDELLERLAVRGYELVRTFTWERSIDLLEDVFLKVPKRKELFRKLGRGELKNGFMRRAEECLRDRDLAGAKFYMEKAGVVDPGDGEIWKRLGSLCSRSGDTGKALEYMKKCGENNLDVHMKLVELHDSLNNEGEKKKTLSYIYGQLGISNFQMGNRGKAEELLLKAVANDPRNPTYTIWLAELYFTGGDLNRALTYYERALSLDGITAEMWNKLGTAYFKLGYPSRAADFYGKAIEISEDFLLPYLNLGIVKLSQGLNQDAFQLFEVLERKLFVDDSNRKSKDFFKRCWEVDSSDMSAVRQLASLPMTEEEIDVAIVYEDICLNKATREHMVDLLKSLRNYCLDLHRIDVARRCDEQIELYNTELCSGIV